MLPLNEGAFVVAGLEVSAGASMGGGFRGAAIGGGFRGAGMGFRAAPIGGGFRTASIGGFRGVGPGIARVGPGFRTAAIGPRFRTAAIGPGFRHVGVAGFRGAPGWRFRRGWGWPVAACLGFGWGYPYYASYYSDACIVWSGYGWVNVCYPYSYF